MNSIIAYIAEFDESKLAQNKNPTNHQNTTTNPPRTQQNLRTVEGENAKKNLNPRWDGLVAKKSKTNGWQRGGSAIDCPEPAEKRVGKEWDSKRVFRGGKKARGEKKRQRREKGQNKGNCEGKKSAITEKKQRGA